MPSSYTISKLKELIFVVSKRYSNLKRREPQTYCPYIFFNNLTNANLLELKKQLFTEEFNFIDGFPFYGADFSTKSISVKADYNNNIKVKLLKNPKEISDTISYITKTKKIYQFYLGNPFYTNVDNAITSINIQIADLDNIKEII